MTLKRVGAEFLGTFLLLFVVVGSGIRVSALGADPGGMLLFHALAVGLALAALIAVFAGVSGAHFNPGVTLAMLARRSISPGSASLFVAAQIIGAFVGVAFAHATFGVALQMGTGGVPGAGALLAEVVATAILVGIVVGLVDQGRSSWIPAALGAWVTSMVITTSSGGFMNPAVAAARTITNTYTGIAPGRAVGYVAAQLIGAALAVVFFGWLKSNPTKGI